MQFVSGIPGRIVGALGNVGRLLYDSGRKIIQGLVDGISNMVGRVTDAVGDVMQAARDLLPFSPAKEGPFSGRGWSRYSGEAIPSDLADGIVSQTRKVRQAALGMAQAAAVGPTLAATGTTGPARTSAQAEAALGRVGMAPAQQGGPTTLVVVDADGNLIGRMRVEAGKVATGEVTPLDEGRPTW